MIGFITDMRREGNIDDIWHTVASKSKSKSE